ncbi:MAG: hypothetical protein U9Q80_04845 [Bacillota bacterium]|nr:hypothetical protein [Bacillota bacterium]
MIIFALVFLVLIITIDPFQDFVENTFYKIYDLYMKAYCKINYNLSAYRYLNHANCRTFYTFDSEQNKVYVVKAKGYKEIVVYDKDGFTEKEVLKKLNLSDDDILSLNVGMSGFDGTLHYLVIIGVEEGYVLDFYSGEILSEKRPVSKSVE